MTNDKELLKLCDEIQSACQHNIPSYAYGDNEAACDMSERLALVSLKVDLLNSRIENQAAADGWKPMPPEATREMYEAAIGSSDKLECYKRMFAAAPTPPTSVERKDG